MGGLPAITNFYEKRLLKEIYERRDQADFTTYAYTQGLDGKLNCLGQAVGYGVFYPIPLTFRDSTLVPNGLFTPDGMSATWLQLVDNKGDVHVVYVEPTIVVSPFKTITQIEKKIRRVKLESCSFQIPCFVPIVERY